MNLNLRSFIICLLCLAHPVGVFSASELTFNDSGQPASLVLGDIDVLAADSSAGFNLRHSIGEKVTVTRLSKISTSGNKIRVSHPDGQPSFTFQIDTYPNHLAIHLLDAQGIGTGRDYSLSLKLDSKDVAAYALNDLMTANLGNQRGRRGVVYYPGLSWPYLWARPRGDGSRGSVVLYSNKLSGKSLDAVLAEIWSAQAAAGHMVRPAVDSWTEADVLAWVDRWVKKFRRLSVISVHPEKTEEELYEMTNKYVIPSGANRVYMFQKSWRESGMTTPRRNIFPNGKASMIAYQEYLAKHGIQLHLKSLSPQIKEEKYLSSTYVDPRIMSWVSGTLAEAVNANAATIRFRPDPASIIEMQDEDFVRIGNEVISVNNMTNTNNDVWILQGCKRGQEGTTAQSHSAGSDMAGLVQSNHSFNFEDDFGMPNSLAEEICGQYGDFLNDVKTSHLHFDGTGRMNKPSWYVREFTDYVYSRVEHPTTGSLVGKGALPAQFETKFSGAQEIYGMWAYHHMCIGIRLYEKGRKHTEIAPSMLDFHFDISDGLMKGTRRIELLGGQSGKTLSMREIDAYGLSDYCFQLFKYWVELAPVFDDADADYVAGFMTKGGNHYKGEDVLVLSKNGEGDYIYTPHRVMGRTSGKDPFIRIDQEWGAVPRFQDIPSGTTMELLNPYEKQEPQVVIHVEQGSKALKDPLIKVNSKGSLAVKGEIQPNEYMKFEGSKTVNVYDNNWNLLRSLPATVKAFTVNKGNNTVTTAAGSGSDTPDLRVQFITLGPVYVLESNKHLSGQVTSTLNAFTTAYYEGEAFASQSGANVISNEHFPYIGTGYLDMGGMGDTVTWNIPVAESGKYTLIFKYANHTAGDLPCDVSVNEVLIRNIAFSPFDKNWKVYWELASDRYNSENTGWSKYWNARVMVDLVAGSNMVNLKVTGSEGPHIDNIGVSTALAQPPGPIVNVKDHGAVGDGVTDNSQAIKNAIAACPVGGSVVFDEGIYMTGSVLLKANMTLWISENAVIRAFQDNSKFQNFSGGFFTKYFMFGSHVDNLTITGGGAIDGNSVGELWNSVKEKPRPALLGFSSSKNVTVTNVDLLNSGFWTFVPQESDSVIIDGINLSSLHGYNKDGINPLDCHDISITNSTVACTDDAICPKTYKSKGIDNLVYRNITVNSTKWKGIKFGHSTVGDFTNSLFEDIAFVHAQLGISLMSTHGANVSNIKFNRIKMSHVLTPIIILNGGGGSSSMKGITISNVEARDVYDSQGSAIMGTKKGNTIYNIEDVSLTNVSVESFKGGLSSVPNSPAEWSGGSKNPAGWPDFPAWGYYIRHVKNIVFNNVTHSVAPADARKDIVLDEVTGFEIVSTKIISDGAVGTESIH